MATTYTGASVERKCKMCDDILYKKSKFYCSVKCYRKGSKRMKRSELSKKRYSLSKMGDKNPMKKKENSDKVSKALKGNIPWNKGKKGAQTAWNKGLTAKTDERLVFYRPTTIKKGETKLAIMGCLALQNSKEPTSIEKKLYEELKSRGILFEKQKLVNDRFIVDAYIPSLNLVIEADGDYWHSLDRVVKKDKAENAYLKTCGFNMLRLTETEINNGLFKEKLNFK